MSFDWVCLTGKFNNQMDDHVQPLLADFGSILFLRETLVWRKVAGNGYRRDARYQPVISLA
jgi:hypothetical protein